MRQARQAPRTLRREVIDRRARLTVDHETEEQVLHVEAFMRAAAARASIVAPATISLYLARAVRPEIGCDDFEPMNLPDAETAAVTAEALVAMYKAGKARKPFMPSLRQADAIAACLKPEVRRAKIILDNLRSKAL